MNQQEFSTVLGLARASMGNPNSAIINHIKKLITLLENAGDTDKAQSFKKLLNREPNIPPHRVILSNEVE